jgi:WD40 repeat protein
MRCILAVHENGIGDIAFSPNGLYLVTASLDRTLALHDANSGEVVGSPWKTTHRPEAAAFHPCAALLVAGAAEGTDIGSFGDSPGRLFLFRFAQNYPPHLKVIQEIHAETDIMSLSFSPGGEHLLMGTFDRLSMFRVHLI